MDRTLFTPPMIETFRVCRRAYQWAFCGSQESKSERTKVSTLCKRFMLRAIADINRQRVRDMHGVQKFLWQHWPAQEFTGGSDPVAQERVIDAFRFAYRALTAYVQRPYRPEGAAVAAVNLKVRARIPQ